MQVEELPEEGGVTGLVADLAWAEVVVALGAEVVSVEVAAGLAAVAHRGDGK